MSNGCDAGKSCRLPAIWVLRLVVAVDCGGVLEIANVELARDSKLRMCKQRILASNVDVSNVCDANKTCYLLRTLFCGSVIAVSL
jgi:hypothetical protein